MHSIIFVCTGNLCRSAMAEAIMRDRIIKTGRTDITVSSMGIHGLDSRPASSMAALVSKEYGIDLSAHLSRQMNAEEVFQADFIFTMEQVHKEFIKIFFPRISERTFLLAAWPNPENRKSNIEDPMGGREKAFRKTFETIAGHIDRILPEILNAFSVPQINS